MKDVKEKSNKELFTVVSTFAGGGGSSTGYRLAGGVVLGINEFIPAAQEAYAKNYPDTYIFKSDIRKLTAKRILRKLNLKVGQLDIFDGSPPCASFSMAGNREKDWGKLKKYSDKKQRTDDLFFEYARLVKGLQPKIFIAENVKGITVGSARHLLGFQQKGFFDSENESIIQTLKNCGYNVAYKVLNSMYYNTPQSRERTIIIGVRKDIRIPITFPKKQYNIIPLKSAFADLQPTKNELAECSIERYSIYSRLCKLKEGDQDKERFNLIKVNSESLSPTLVQTASCLSAASICHWDDRKFTVKEAIRIMGFPDDYYLGDTYKNKIERLGRAVPPLMMKEVAEHLYKTILSKIK